MTAKITIPHGNENFAVQPHPTEDWLLVKPTGVKQKWTKDELWWRSMVVAPDGTVLSAGLPKFKNYGEGNDEGKAFTAALNSDDPVVFTEKLDGSLAIRSVVNGKVVWRTRGTFGTEDNDLLRDIRKHAEQYPLLSDPEWFAVVSLHFEFCHPDHQIILPVHKPSLTLLSGVHHADLQLEQHGTLTEMAGMIGCPVVEVHELPRSVDDLVALIDEFKGREGIVARYDGEQRYVKLKSAEYLAQHRLRFAFTPRNAVEMCRQLKFTTGDQFIEHLYSLGLDWEIASERVRWFYVYDEARKVVDAAMADVVQFVSTYGDLYGTKEGGKEYARLVTEAYEDQNMRTPCFLLASGKATAEQAGEAMLGKLCEAMIKARGEADVPAVALPE